MTIIPPELIESIPVFVQQINKNSTQFSDGVSGRREVRNATVYSAPVSIPAQVVFGNKDQETKFSGLGPDEQIMGYLVVRFVDLKAKGVDLKRGDKIVGMGNPMADYDLYLLHSNNKPAAQFSSLGNFTIARVFFGDRNPVGS